MLYAKGTVCYWDTLIDKKITRLTGKVINPPKSMEQPYEMEGRNLRGNNISYKELVYHSQLTEIELVEVNEIRLISQGDRTVGIFPKQWIIELKDAFVAPEDLDDFMTKLEEAWEYIADDAVITLKTTPQI